MTDTSAMQCTKVTECSSNEVIWPWVRQVPSVIVCGLEDALERLDFYAEE